MSASQTLIFLLRRFYSHARASHSLSDFVRRMFVSKRSKINVCFADAYFPLALTISSDVVTVNSFKHCFLIFLH